jgi:O-antigen ligase
MEIGGAFKVEVPLEIGLAVFNVLLLGFLIRNFKAVAWNNRILWAVVGLVLASGWSIVNAVYPWVALKAWIVLLNYILAFFGAWHILQFSKSEQTQLIRVAGLSYGVLLVYAAVRYWLLGVHYQNSYLIGQPFAVGHTLLCAMGFPLWLYLTNLIFTKKAAYWQMALCFAYTAFILLSYSRLYWVLIPVFLGIFVLFYWKKARWYFVALGLMTLVAGYFSYHYIKDKRDREQAWLDPNDHNTLFVQIQSIFELRTNESNTERLNRWKMGKVMLDEHPLSGVGLNNYAQVYPDISKRFTFEKTTRSDMMMNAHQWYLGCLYEQGIVGAAALLLFFIAFLSYYRRFTFLASLIFLHYLALGFIEDFMLLPEVSPAFWLCVGWGSVMFAKDTQD